MLSRGQVFGAVGRVVHAGEVTLSESRYPPGSMTPPHSHELPMFVLVIDGSFDESFEHRHRTCGPLRVLYRPPGEHHSQRFLERGSACLTIELPARAGASMHDADGRTSMLGVPTLSALRIYDEFCRPNTDTELVIEELTGELEAYVARMPHITERQIPDWLLRTRELIDARFNEPLRMSDLTLESGVHRVHLSRTFHRFLGCGVGGYIRRVRVHSACARIRDTNDSMSRVACEVGFSDESHMGRAFREVLGYPPTRYLRARRD
jgi:AraC family transcriptional regulator